MRLIKITSAFENQNIIYVYSDWSSVPLLAPAVLRIFRFLIANFEYWILFAVSESYLLIVSFYYIPKVI